MKPMDKKDFILLKAIFNENMHNALMNEDLNKLEDIFKRDYSYELSENMVEDHPLTLKDLKNLKEAHIKELKTDDLSWAL